MNNVTMIKAKVRLLLYRESCQFSGVIQDKGKTIVYGYNTELEYWGFWEYSPKKFGLGVLTPLEMNLTEQDALFKKNILLSPVIQESLT